MKGIIFNLLQQVVTDAYGADLWDDLLESAELDGAYTSLGNYSDQELLRLVVVASKALNLPPDDIIRWFGEKALPLLAERYPAFFSSHSKTKPFLLTLNDIIHPEVRKLYPKADAPNFDFDEPSNNVLLLSYQSSRRLCSFAEGLILGAANYYRDSVSVVHDNCMKQGDPRCTLRCTFLEPIPQ
jgi:hypothetical protein